MYFYTSIRSVNNYIAMNWLLSQYKSSKNKYVYLFLANKNEIELETVLLVDIFNEIKSTASPKPSQIVMKIDIEVFECGTFLGSPEFITPPQDIPITAVIMEWIYLTDDGSYPKMCPKDKVEELTKLYLSNGYTPFLVKDDLRELTKLDTRKFGVKW